MDITTRKVAELSTDPANARIHPQRNVEAIVASLRRFGQQKPIVVDKSNVVRAGNGTLEAARILGWDEIQCVHTNLVSTEAIAYAIADNRSAELAEWDDAVLAATLESLEAEGMLLDVGFDEKELKQLLATVNQGEIVEDEVPEPPENPITKTGDLWVMGEHRLLCGDSTKAEDVGRLMGGAKADLCFTSPPYGQQRDYTKESDCSDWDKLMRGVFENLPMSPAGQVLVNLGLIHRDGEWMPYWDGWIEWMRTQGWRRFGWYVWDQGFGLPGDWNGRLAPSHEFVFHFNKSSLRPEKFTRKKEENIKARHSGQSTMRSASGELKAFTSPEASSQPNKIPDSIIHINRASGGHGIDHPAIFPVELPSFAMKSWPGVAYEPFCGSGTTLIAAEQLSRRCYAMEIEPRYVDVCVKRWETLTGREAVLECK